MTWHGTTEPPERVHTVRLDEEITIAVRLPAACDCCDGNLWAYICVLGKPRAITERGSVCWMDLDFVGVMGEVW